MLWLVDRQADGWRTDKGWLSTVADIDGRTDGRTDGRAGGQSDRRTGGGWQTDGRMDRWTAGWQTDGRTDGQAGERTHDVR